MLTWRRTPMRTTIDIDDELLEEARKLAPGTTKRDLIHLSLKELVRRRKIERLLGLYGTSPIDLAAEDVVEYRKRDGR
jgi:Arc/MetJ family transcription regulator